MLLLPPSASAIFSRALNWWLLIGLISAKIKHGDAGEGGGFFFWHQYLTEKKVFVYSSLLVAPLAPQKNHKSDVRAARLLSINSFISPQKEKKNYRSDIRATKRPLIRSKVLGSSAIYRYFRKFSAVSFDFRWTTSFL